jgi:hypothetical protein
LLLAVVIRRTSSIRGSAEKPATADVQRSKTAFPARQKETIISIAIIGAGAIGSAIARAHSLATVSTHPLPTAVARNHCRPL